MNTFEKIVAFFQAEMPTPTNYGWFHILCLLAVIAFTVFLCVKFKNCSDKVFRRIMFVCWLVMILFEIYKQIVFSYDSKTDVWDYQWYAFPFQICSTPLFVLPFIFTAKESKFQDAFIMYMITYSLLGGVGVMLCPNNVFVKTIGINIQTMVHHGLQVALGFFCACKNIKKFKFINLINCFVIFFILANIAIVINEVGNVLTTESVNMFYFSRHHESIFPIIKDLIPILPYPVFLLIYYPVFFAITLAIYYCFIGVEKLIINLKNKKNA